MSVVPAREGFESDDLSCAQVGLDLINGSYPVFIERRAQLPFQQRFAFDGGFQIVVKNLYPAASAVLGLIQRKVGAADPVGGPDVLASNRGNTRAHTGVQHIAGNRQRLGQIVHKRVGNIGQAFFARGAFDDDRELVAAQPCRQGSCRGAGGEFFCNNLEKGIAGRMTQGVVDGLEMVEVGQKY